MFDQTGSKIFYFWCYTSRGFRTVRSTIFPHSCISTLVFQMYLNGWYVTLISVCSNSHRFFSGEAGSCFGSVGVNQSALAVIAVMWEQDELLRMFYLPASLWCLFCISHILITGYNTYSVFSIQIPLQRNWRQEKSQDTVFVSMLQTGHDANRRTPIEWCWNVCLGVVLDI